MSPPLITLEEHFFSLAATHSPYHRSKYSEQFRNIPCLAEKLHDLDTLRLQQMDGGHISLQVISHAPGALSAEECRDANDQLAEAVQRHPERFAAFAALPVAEPGIAAGELRRCVGELGFTGALIDAHTKEGGYYEGKEYDVFWREFEELGVPCYLHPTWTTDAMMQGIYTGEFSEAASKSISASGFGWHSDVATHVLKLFAGGVFDRFPKLKLILGHFGEMLPFMLERVEVLSRRWGERRRGWMEVWRENVWVTTSGVWSLNPMKTLLGNTSVERVMYSVDYPFQQNEVGWNWWRELEGSGLVDEEGLERIAYRNAEELLRVKVVKRFD